MRVIGTHAGCGGNILYYSTSSQGYRECEKCGADGKYGRPSPNTEDEQRDFERAAAGPAERKGRRS